MDDTTCRVEQMYNAFPYPSPTGGKNLKELRGLLTIFAAENHYDFIGKRILDAGAGTGDRLIEAARGLPDTQFLAVEALSIVQAGFVQSVVISKVGLEERQSALLRKFPRFHVSGIVTGKTV